MEHQVRRVLKPKVVCAAIALAFASLAQAQVFTWSSGDYLAVPLPRTLGSGSVINAVAGGQKSLTGSIVNDGRINWQTSNLLYFLGDATTLRNNGTFDQQTDGRIFPSAYSTTVPTFDNAGILKKTGGSGDLLIDTVLVNRSGATLDASSGRIVYGNKAAFDAGSIFKGTGTHVFNENNSTFAFGGSFTGENNLLFALGTYNATALTKPQTNATWSGGDFTGLWNIDTGRTLSAVAGHTKSISSNFTNDGTIAWNTTNVLYFLGDATTLRNNGTFDQQTDGRIFPNAYSTTVPTFDNAGTLTKTGGTGDLLISTALINTGAIESLSGNIVLPTNWRNDGTLRGDAAFQTNMLSNAGDVAPGLPNPADAIATLNLTGALIETPAGSLSFDVTTGGLSDVFNITGAVTFDGTVRVARFGDYMAQIGDTFRVMNFASFSGSLDAVNEFGFGGGVEFEARYSPTFLELRVVAVPEPATWALMAAGLIVLLRAQHRARAARKQA